MASVDYYLCDACGKKTFYDATLSYDGDNGDPTFNKRWPDGDVGGMAVICKACAENHNVFVSYDPDKPERKKNE